MIQRFNKIPFLILCVVNALSSAAQNNMYNQLGAKTFYQQLQSSPGILLDVRTTREFENGHIEESGNLNYYALDFKRKLQLLPKDSPIYLYCNTGYRSERAAKFLISKGYENVNNLEQGMLDWYIEELPVIMSAGARPDLTDRYSQEEFEHLVNSNELVLVDFYAPWCAPCKEMMPMIDSLKVDLHPEILVLKVNVDASRQLAKELKIKEVPYFRTYSGGEIQNDWSGKTTRTEFESIAERLQIN